MSASWAALKMLCPHGESLTRNPMLADLNVAEVSRNAVLVLAHLVLDGEGNFEKRCDRHGLVEGVDLAIDFLDCSLVLGCGSLVEVLEAPHLASQAGDGVGVGADFA